MRASKVIPTGASYTALVDILFATIGVFVIVFALQDVEPPQDLQPAPYAHLILCDEGPALSYLGVDAAEPLLLDMTALEDGQLSDLLSSGGRVLVALHGDCLTQNGDDSVAQRLGAFEESLSEVPTTGAKPMTLFEFSPIGEAERLRDRFLAAVPTAGQL